MSKATLVLKFDNSVYTLTDIVDTLEDMDVEVTAMSNSDEIERLEEIEAIIEGHSDDCDLTVYDKVEKTQEILSK